MRHFVCSKWIDLSFSQKYVRAHFGYNGQLDEEIPCKELALNFTKGEILEVSNQDDPDWWQVLLYETLLLTLITIVPLGT